MSRSQPLVGTSSQPQDTLDLFSDFSFIEQGPEEEDLFSDFDFIDEVPQVDQEVDEDDIDFSSFSFSNERVDTLKNDGISLYTNSLSDIEKNSWYNKNRYEDIKTDPRIIPRFMRKFMEGFAPVPLDLSSNVQKPDTTSETVAELSGTILGYGASWLTGAGLLSGLKIVGTGPKVAMQLRKASKLWDDVILMNKRAKGAKTLRSKTILNGKAKRLQEELDLSLSKAGILENSSLLGRQKHYKRFITKIGADDYGIGKFLANVDFVKASGDDMAIRAANAVQLGLTNLAGSHWAFQKTIPIRDEMGDLIIADRIWKPSLDALLMTAGGMPRVLGAGMIGSLSLTSGASGRALESAIVFGAGIGASQMGIGMYGEGERTLSENLIDGAIFTAAHYIGVGADNMRIKHAIREGLGSVISDKKVQKSITQAMSDNTLDKIKLYISTKRPEFLRRRFTHKTRKNVTVQFEKVTKNKKGDHQLVYRYLTDPKDGMKGTDVVITGPTKQAVLNKFFKDYRNVLPNIKKFSKRYLEKSPNTLKPGTVLKRRWKDDYVEHQKLVRSVNKLEGKLGLTRRESNALRKGAFKNTYGNTDNMSMEQLKTYKEMIDPRSRFRDIKISTIDSVLPFELPDNFIEKSREFSGIGAAFKKFGFHPISNISKWGSEGVEMSRRMIDFADTKNIVRGSFQEFVTDVTSNFLPFVRKKKYYNSITALLGDEKLNLISDIKTAGKIADSKLLKARLRDLFDQTFVDFGQINVKIRTSENNFVPILRLYDQKGKIIKISDKSFDNGDVLKILRGKNNKVFNKNGKKVIVDVSKSMDESAYVKDFVPHYLSEKARTIFGNDRESFKTNLTNAIRASNKGASETDIARIVQNFIDFGKSNKPLGILNTRKIDIPPYMLVEKNSTRIIQIDEIPHISNIKKGMEVTDIDGTKRVVGNIIELYEKDFSKIFSNYTNQVANSMALFQNFDEKGIHGDVAYRLLQGIQTKYGITQRHYAADNLSKLIQGEEPNFYSVVGQKATTGVANIYLSGPSAVIKNFLTGQTQNFMSEGTIKFMKGWYKYTADRKFYRELTENVGGLSGNIDELAFVYKSIPGKVVTSISAPFRFIERINRRASVAIADVSTRDAIDSIVKNKPSTFFNGAKEARKTLKLSMNMDDTSIDYMVNALKKRKAYGDGAFELALGSDKKFRDIYKRGLYKSQAATQGVTQLPYIPTWMANNKIKPLTLFYRTAYRVTENTYNRAVVPFILDGNPFPAMRYMGGATVSGKVLYDWYYGHALGKDLLDKNFKEVPMEWFDWLVRGEGLGLFSNIADEFGGVLDAYIPVIYQFGQESWNFVNSIPALLMHDPKLAAKGIVDFSKKHISLAKQAEDFYKNMNNDITKRFDNQRRIMNQFLLQYPQFKNREERNQAIQLLERGKLKTEPFYLRLLGESLLYGDEEQFTSDFIKTRAFMEREEKRLEASRGKSFYLGEIRSEVHKKIKNSLSQRLRPYPKAWEEPLHGQTPFINHYKSKLNEDDKKELEELFKIYKKRERLLLRVISKTYPNYQTD